MGNNTEDKDYIKIRKHELEFLYKQIESLEKQLENVVSENKALIENMKLETNQHESDVVNFRKIMLRLLNGIITFIVLYLIGYWIQVIFFRK